MTQYTLMDKKGGKAAFGVFLFAMLLLARDTLITSCLLGFTKSQILMLGIICLVGLGFLTVCQKEWKSIVTDKRMTVMALSAFLILLPMVAKRDWQMMYLSVLLCLLTAVFLTYFISFRELAKYYILILTVLGVYSIVAMWILRPLPLWSAEIAVNTANTHSP